MNRFYLLVIRLIGVLNQLPQPFGGLILICLMVSIFVILPIVVLEKSGIIPKGGAVNTQEECVYFANGC